jgi:type II secretory pathway pseudopilin PulG
MTCQSAQTRNRAFSLVELVMSIGVLSVLVGAMGSIIALATHALPDADSAITRAIDADQAMAELRSDLGYATRITEWGPNGVTLITPDRNGDGQTERIRYAWAGGPGDALTRVINGGTEQSLASPINRFTFSTTTRAVSETYAGFLVESGWQTIADQLDDSSASDKKIKSDEWAAQVFRPQGLGPNDKWSLNSVAFRAKQSSPSLGWLIIEVRPVDENMQPSDTVLASGMIYELFIPSSYGWLTLNLTNPITDLRADESLCIVWRTETGGDAAEIEYQGGDLDDTGCAWVEGDPDWKTPETQKGAIYTVTGTLSQPGADQTITRYVATNATIQFHSLDGTGARDIDRSAELRLANQPDVVEASWELDFDTDPTAIDANGDGQGDWQMHSGDPFKTSKLKDGVWEVDGQLDSAPNQDFNEPTILEATCRADQTGRIGPIVRINADYAGGTFAPIWFSVEQEDDSSQTVKLYTKPSSADDTLLREVTGLGSGMVTVRLIIDPDLNTVHLQTDGVDRGTYKYTPYTPNGSETTQRFVAISAGDGKAEVDWVRIRAFGDQP